MPSISRLEVLHQRARILQTIRAFFVERHFLEVETPHRIPTNAPEPMIEPVESQAWQLHTSPELAMKRLLSQGAPDLFQLCRCWRQAERGARHLPEFTLLEWYRREADYTVLMEDCEQLFRRLAGDRLRWQGHTVNLEVPWERLTLAEAFHRYADTTVERALKDGCFDEVYAFEVEPNLGLKRPVFLYEFPTALASLARKKPGKPDVAERFELYMAGMELANAFSELTDEAEQRHRFEADVEQIAAQGRQAAMPEPFLGCLSRLPDCAGIALGVDRLVMLLLDIACIDDVVAFPPEKL